MLKNHVQPAASSGDFRCFWTGCRVFLKPARNFSWLQSHVIAKHCGSRPYRCPVPGCSFRFSSPKFAQRHVNNHLDKELQLGRLWSAAAGDEPHDPVAASCSSSSCSSSAAAHDGDASSSSLNALKAPSDCASSYPMHKRELKFRSNCFSFVFVLFASFRFARCLTSAVSDFTRFSPCLSDRHGSR
ncbi:unnamed protein product [Soboliphyme baturini]|uniref:C2H2-type domain-containing protein n=1 Tax=Soboliphyme baturini TaxID=241478 RepID=A0A183ILB6_9BILA|nr:unnamed protein product [Soboliphyme baturini]